MKEGQNRRRRRRNLSSINSDRINLDKCKENVIFFLAGELGLLLLNILCYGDMYWMIPEQVLMVPCFKILKERKNKKEQQLYQKGFQDLLQSLLTSLQAGYSLNNSCRIALRELESLYEGEQNPMLGQMRRIVQGIDLHIALEQLFMDFAERTNLEEARQFAVVIEIVQSTGGNVVEIYISLLSILGIASIVAIVFESICIVSGITKGFTEILLRYCIGGILFIAAFVLAILKCFRELRRIRKAPETCLADYNKKNRENDNAEQYNRRGNKAMSVVKTEAEWDMKTDWNTEGEGTTILSLEKESFYPMLRDMETGIVSIIKSCPFYIGSAEGVNQLKISDKTVSREHAVILEAFYENGGEGYILRDLDSTNGTWIDGRKIKKGSQERLQEGATVRFAQKEYRFLLEHTTI